MAKILVVEDEEALRVLAESILGEIGHETTTTANPAEALALVGSEQKFDLLFTDIGLGDDLQAGIKLAREVMENLPILPVLYTTGQGVTSGMKALFVGRFHFIPKPYTMDGLTTSIGNALAQP